VTPKTRRNPVEVIVTNNGNLKRTCFRSVAGNVISNVLKSVRSQGVESGNHSRTKKKSRHCL
jgi:hypothetical protein